MTNSFFKKSLNTLSKLLNPFSSTAPQELSFEETLKLAEEGNDKAQFNVAIMYEEGDGVQKNDAEAIKWYEKVASLGDAVSQSKVGAAYYYGKGVEKKH